MPGKKGEKKNTDRDSEPSKPGDKQYCSTSQRGRDIKAARQEKEEKIREAMQSTMAELLQGCASRSLTKTRGRGRARLAEELQKVERKKRLGERLKRERSRRVRAG